MQLNKIAKFCDAYGAHSAHIPEIAEAAKKVDALAHNLRAETKVLPYFLRSNIDFSLHALADLNFSIATMLKNGQVSSVEALSRVASEQAVNLLYVIEGASDERAKSMLNNYVAEAIRKAKIWLKYLRSSGGNSNGAAQKLEHMEFWKSEFDASGQFKELPSWPSAVDRFSSVGAEELYRTIFASASDSIHGFPDDIFNTTILGYCPEEMRDTAVQAYKIEKHSFAVFLAAYALGLYVDAVYRLAEILESESTVEALTPIGAAINAIILAHENDHVQVTSSLMTADSTANQSQIN